MRHTIHRVLLVSAIMISSASPDEAEAAEIERGGSGGESADCACGSFGDVENDTDDETEDGAELSADAAAEPSDESEQDGCETP